MKFTPKWERKSLPINWINPDPLAKVIINIQHNKQKVNRFFKKIGGNYGNKKKYLIGNIR